VRLVVVAHAETTGTRAAVFGDVGDLVDEVAAPALRTPGRWWSAPEPACAATASALADDPTAVAVLDDLRGPDLGVWAGRPLDEVIATDPAGLATWLTEPGAAPHGGESLAALLTRVGDVLDGLTWPDAGATLSVTPLAARAVAVHALAGPPASVLHLDVAPGAALRLARTGGTWRLSALVPPAARVAPGTRKGPRVSGVPD
jgi:broad specificity phosphatase PhoE